MNETLKRTLKDADIKFVRILWCDNANIIRAKAAHVNYLEEYIDNGVGITVAQMALPVMYDSVVDDAGLGPVGEVRPPDAPRTAAGWFRGNGPRRVPSPRSGDRSPGRARPGLRAGGTGSGDRPL